MTSIFVANSEADLDAIAKKLLTQFSENRIFLFYGEMGTGKTTFIKAICRALGSTDETSSPTFSIVNEYMYDGGSIFHFDFYRLKNEMEALDIGVEEYFDSGNYCFIEWPEKIPNLLPEKFCEVHIGLMENGRREISVS